MGLSEVKEKKEKQKVNEKFVLNQVVLHRENQVGSGIMSILVSCLGKTHLGRLC